MDLNIEEQKSKEFIQFNFFPLISKIFQILKIFVNTNNYFLKNILLKKNI